MCFGKLDADFFGVVPSECWWHVLLPFGLWGRAGRRLSDRLPWRNSYSTREFLQRYLLCRRGCIGSLGGISALRLGLRLVDRVRHRWLRCRIPGLRELLRGRWSRRRRRRRHGRG